MYSSSAGAGFGCGGVDHQLIKIWRWIFLSIRAPEHPIYAVTTSDRERERERERESGAVSVINESYLKISWK